MIHKIATRVKRYKQYLDRYFDRFDRFSAQWLAVYVEMRLYITRKVEKRMQLIQIYSFTQNIMFQKGNIIK